MKRVLIFLVLFFGLLPQGINAASEDIDNWENKKYWLKKVKFAHVFLCGTYEEGMKDKYFGGDLRKYQSKLKKGYEEQCTDIDSYIISNLNFMLLNQKVRSCQSFFLDDKPNKEINKLSKKRKDNIFQDCRSFYKYYGDTRLKNYPFFYNAFGYYYKAFYLDGVTKKEIDYHLDQTAYEFSKCKKKYDNAVKSDQYKTCNTNVFKKFDIYKRF